MRKKFKILSYSVTGIFLIALFWGNSKRSFVKEEKNVPVAIVRKLEAVAALGQLQPSGEVRILAAPISGFGGSPRIKKILIEEGDEVKLGDVLAVFDNQTSLLYDLELLEARLITLNKKINSQEREVARYKELVAFGVSPEILLDEQKDELQQSFGQLKQLYQK